MVWQTPPMAIWPWVVVIAICGTYSHFCMTHALRHAEANTVVPLDFLRVPRTALAAWLVFAERFDVFTAIGAAVILAGNLLNLKPRGSTLPAQAKPGGEQCGAIADRRPALAAHMTLSEQTNDTASPRLESNGRPKLMRPRPLSRHSWWCNRNSSSPSNVM